MKTYTIVDLQKMTNKLNIMSRELFRYDSNWRIEVQQKHARLKRIAYIYCRTIGSIEFLETETGSDEYKFTVIDAANVNIGFQDIYKAAEYLKLV